LRAASKLGEAKARGAKSSLQANIGVLVAAPPPNHDRVNEKGKARAANMDNVYVSELLTNNECLTKSMR